MSRLSREVKAQLRPQLLARRKALSPEQVASSSRAILQRLLQLEEYRCSRLVHTYVSSKDNEVDTTALIRLRLKEKKRVAVPVVRPGTRLLQHAEIQDLGQLQPGRWGLFAPVFGHSLWLTDLAQIDLVVVPGLAFDPGGRRLGLGGGYYDRFLALVQAPKVGLVCQDLLMDELPVEPHDVPVNIVVTETAVHFCEEKTHAL